MCWRLVLSIQVDFAADLFADPRDLFFSKFFFCISDVSHFFIHIDFIDQFTFCDVGVDHIFGNNFD